MKKLIALLLAAILCLSFAACGSKLETKTNNKTSEVEPTLEPAPTPTPTPTPTPEPENSLLNVSDFENLLKQLPMFVESTKYIVQDEQYKALYPDMLQATLQNNTTHDIKSAVVAFVAWDENNLPVKLKKNFDFSGGAYIQQVNYNDINMIPNSTFGESGGFAIDESCGVKTFKAIVVSFETFEGDTWENPYFDEWCKLYEGVKYSDDLAVNVLIEDSEFEVNQQGME